MNALVGARARLRPVKSELLSLTERLRWLSALRLGLAVVVVTVALTLPGVRAFAPSTLVAASVAYVLAGLAATVGVRVWRRPALTIVGGTLLLDGVYLAWATYSTGGLDSPLRFAIAVQVVAVTLASSYRTGFEMAAWHSLLMFVSLYAQAAGILDVHEGRVSVLPGGEDFWTAALLSAGSVWAVAIGSAAFGSVNERELRRQKADLGRLSLMVRTMDGASDGPEIARILLDDLCDTFGFSRGVVLASPQGDLAVMALVGTSATTPLVESGLDPVMERAWDGRRTQLVRKLDPAVDPRLAALLPEGRNVAVIPMHLTGGQRLGVVTLEVGGAAGTIKRWVLALAEQYVSHAALALHNAWLLRELNLKLEENQALQQRLFAHNVSLEEQVEERTKELRESLADLGLLHAERRRLLARLVDAQEEERHRVANDIHDDPLQKLVIIVMRMNLIKMREVDPETLHELDALAETVRSAIDSMRDMIFQLRPPSLDEEGIAAALVEYLDRLGGELAFEVDDRLREEPPSELRLIMYRITQEALANVRKHAQAANVLVRIDERDGGYRIRVEDDGVGFHAPEMLQSAPGHLGLSAMRERAEKVGGWCRVSSLAGGGTVVESWLPGTPAEADGTAASGSGSDAAGSPRHLVLVNGSATPVAG